MSGLTKSAAEILRDMLSKGWHVSFHADKMMPLGEWEFTKLCHTSSGEIWRIGIDAHMETAVSEALKNELPEERHAK